MKRKRPTKKSAPRRDLPYHCQKIRNGNDGGGKDDKRGKLGANSSGVLCGREKSASDR
jgi:hypothetical protein